MSSLANDNQVNNDTISNNAEVPSGGRDDDDNDDEGEWSADSEEGNEDDSDDDSSASDHTVTRYLNEDEFGADRDFTLEDVLAMKARKPEASGINIRFNNRREFCMQMEHVLMDPTMRTTLLEIKIIPSRSWQGSQWDGYETGDQLYMLPDDIEEEDCKKLVVECLGKMPNLRKLSICEDFFGFPYNDVKDNRLSLAEYVLANWHRIGSMDRQFALRVAETIRILPNEYHESVLKETMRRLSSNSLTNAESINDEEKDNSGEDDVELLFPSLEHLEIYNAGFPKPNHRRNQNTSRTLSRLLSANNVQLESLLVKEATMCNDGDMGDSSDGSGFKTHVLPNALHLFSDCIRACNDTLQEALFKAYDFVQKPESPGPYNEAFQDVMKALHNNKKIEIVKIASEWGTYTEVLCSITEESKDKMMKMLQSNTTIKFMRFRVSTGEPKFGQYFDYDTELEECLQYYTKQNRLNRATLLAEAPGETDDWIDAITRPNITYFDRDDIIDYYGGGGSDEELIRDRLVDNCDTFTEGVIVDGEINDGAIVDNLDLLYLTIRSFPRILDIGRGSSFFKEAVATGPSLSLNLNNPLYKNQGKAKRFKSRRKKGRR